MRIEIPIERIGGACLLLLTVAAMLSLNVAGYDPAVDGFEVELRRLAGIADWQVATYTAFQVLSGLGMLGGAVMLCLALRRYSAATAVLAAVALAAAGLLTLLASAVYATSAELADEYVTATAGHAEVVLTTARAFVLVLKAIVHVTSLALALGVYGFALITGRHRLVPSWLGFVVGASVASLGAALVSGILGASWAWLFLGPGYGLMLLWLLVAGGWLLLGGSGKGGPAREAASKEGVASNLAS